MEQSYSKIETEGRSQTTEGRAGAGVRLIPRGDVAWVELDLPGEKVNKISLAVGEELERVLRDLKNSSYKAMVFISRKKGVFIAGADISEIKKLNTYADYKRAIQSGQKIMNSIEDLSIPTIAAIDGACIGGGCELALACDYRIMTNDSSTKIGLPEARLGLLPGWGGCVRLPKLVGLQSSLDIILTGKSIIGRKAVKMGLVEECVPRELLEERVGLFIEGILSGQKRKAKFKPKGFVNKFLESPFGRLFIWRLSKKAVLKETKGFYPAPLKALEVVKATYGLRDRSKALAVECEGFCEVAQSDVSRNLIDLFFLMGGVKKKTGVLNSDVEPAKVSRVGVLGAGIMGGGIAQLAADKGYRVRMKDINEEALAKGFQAAQSIWNKLVRRRRLTLPEFNKKMSFISGGLDFSGFRSMDVVIEAIVEDMGIKKKVISETASHCNKDCIIATNTSALSVTEMAQAHPHPENFVGMHFFNPVHKMPLVEVIRGEKTSDKATATIFELSKKMGKTPVVVKDQPGFLVNRLLLPCLCEGLFLMSEGMSVEKMDSYLTHGFGMPMGVLRLFDEVGWDTAIKVLKDFRSVMGGRVQFSRNN